MTPAAGLLVSELARDGGPAGLEVVRNRMLSERAE